MRVLDLFSGIGGFSLGLERAGMTTVAFCEIDPIARRILKKHWPETPICSDVRTLKGTEYGAIDVVCGGFPCTDISRAGKMAGLAGERSGLWGEMRRIIGEAGPRFVLIENVARLCADGLDTVLADLDALGFDAEWHCIPGFAVGAPQVRDRVYVVANARALGHRGAGWVGRWLSGTEEARRHGWRGEPQGDVQLWPEPALDRVAYGVPGGVDGCRKLGNAVIPQIPELLGRAILATYNAELCGGRSPSERTTG